MYSWILFSALKYATFKFILIPGLPKKPTIGKKTVLGHEYIKPFGKHPKYDLFVILF